MFKANSIRRLIQRTGGVRFVVFAVLLTSSFCFAQPQAPIVWGEARWANLAGWPGLPQITTLRVIPMGDTLLFTALNVASAVSDTILVCSSFDNGQTFTPWVPITDGTFSCSVHFAGSASHFYCFINKGDPLPTAVWLRISTDGGLTWGPALQYRQDAFGFRGFASGGEVIAKYIREDHYVIRSVNYGQSWSAPVLLDTGRFDLYNAEQAMAFTKTHRLIIEQPSESMNDPRLYVAMGDSNGQNWTPFELLPCQYDDEWWASQDRAAIVGDTTGEATGMLAAFGDAGFNPLWPLHYRSSDVGTGWESCAPMTEEQYVIPWPHSTYVPLHIIMGKLWLVGWEHLDAGWGNVLMTRFSANHGKDWYPLQVAADSVFQITEFSGQIRGDQIDVYWSQGCNQQGPTDFRMVGGTITPDTTFPELLAVMMPPETVSVGQPILFNVSATDNDTLSDVRLMIQELGGTTWRGSLHSVGDDIYDTLWLVPDTGYYTYWLETEDWWEHVRTLPDSGTFHFVTEGWSAANDETLLPSSFDVSVYPNPSNGWPTLTLSPDWIKNSPATVAIYNVLGQNIYELNVTQSAVTFGGAPEIGTGIYFARITSGERSVLQKFLILK